MWRSWPMDIYRITKGCMSNLGTGASHVANEHKIVLVSRNILTYLWAESYGHFRFEDFFWLKSAKVSLKITYFHVSTYFTFVACKTASSSRARFSFSTDSQYFFVLPFWGLYYEHFTLFGDIYFCFLQKEFFSKSNKFVFQVRLACE